MTSYALSYPFVYRYRPLVRRSARALFLPRTAQQVRSIGALREVARALAALGGIAAWGIAMLLLVG